MNEGKKDAGFSGMHVCNVMMRIQIVIPFLAAYLPGDP